MRKNKNSGPSSVEDQYRAANVEISRQNNPDLDSVPVPRYTSEEHETWAQMFARQQQQLPGRACDEYLQALEKMNLPKTKIPKLKDVSKVLEDETGWRVTRVAGLVPEKEFFECLAQKLFPCTDFIRKKNELEYTPSPDMFHDIFGHLPLITNRSFADFFEKFGKAALKAKPEQIEALQKIYWFTIEFGLIRNIGGVRIYGSGILSSVGEVSYCLGPLVRRHPFHYDIVTKQFYEIHHMQDDLFVVDSFEWLKESFDAYCAKNDL